jgi:hypothetical protein
MSASTHSGSIHICRQAEGETHFSDSAGLLEKLASGFGSGPAWIMKWKYIEMKIKRILNDIRNGFWEDSKFLFLHFLPFSF